ncbi:MAG: response regulator transcription factor [Lachnospiraceae bacterium]|nr:response regulator transcription factor [Lachnospiraceae bacterium]
MKNRQDKLILLIEDNEDVQDLNRSMLEDEGFIVKTAMTLAGARKSVRQQIPDAIILDIGMPDGNGLDFLREFRKISKIPVLLLTGYGEDNDIIRGYDNGCNDYLAKPYTFGVLLARLKSLLQSAEQIPERITYGLLSLDMQCGQAFANGEDLFLTQKEFFLLSLFIQHEGVTLNADYLYKKVWGQPMNKDNQAVRKAVHRLRASLNNSGYTITVMRGKGYVFEKS